MVLFWLVNAALGHVVASEHIGRHISQYLPDTRAQFAKARLRLSWRGVFVRAEQLHLQGKSGGLYAPRADFFIGADKTQVALHAPRITIINNTNNDNHNDNGKDDNVDNSDNNNNGDNEKDDKVNNNKDNNQNNHIGGDDDDGGGFGFPFPLVGDEWAIVGNDAVFTIVGFGFDEWLPQRAAGFTVLSRGGVVRLAIAGEDEGNTLLAKWQDGGGIAHLAITRAGDDMPMRSLHLTAAVDDDSVSVIAAAGALRVGGVFASSAVVRAQMPQAALLKWAAGAGLPDGVPVSARLYAVEVAGLPHSDIAASGVLHPADDGGLWVSDGALLFGDKSSALSGGGDIVMDEHFGLASLHITGRIAVAAAKLYQYIPPSPAREWLEESLTGGDIGAAAFAVSGNAEDIQNGRGWNATAAFSGGNIIIGEGWPEAKALAGALFLHNDNITIIGEGTFADLAVTDITAVIDNFAADAPASLRLLMRASPAPLGEYKRAALAVDALRPALTIVQTANFFGNGALAVLLTVPLTSAQDTFYYVSVGVRDGVLAPGNALPTLTALSGAIVAGNAFLTAAVGGLLYDKPAKVFYDGGRITLLSTINAARAFALAGEAGLQKYFSGDAAFTLYTGGGNTTILAGLQNITPALPPPLDTIGGGRLQMIIGAGGDKEVSIFAIASSATVRVLQSADNIVAGINVPLPAAGIAAAGEGWDLDAWMALSGGGSAGVSLSVRSGKLLGMRHRFLHLRMPPSADDARMVFVRSPVAEGTVAFSPRAVRGVFDKLHLEGFDGGGGDSLADDIFALSVSLRVRQLALVGVTLGAMVLDGAPDEGGGWKLRQMRITDGDNVLHFAGFGGRGGATVSAGLHAPDVVRLLEQFALTGLVQSGAMTVRGSLSWADAAPSLAALRGDFRIDAADVRYLQLQEGVSGLLALFSPASLFSLGFTELGKPGVRFDINGDIALVGGFAASESLTMRNEDIHITLGGRTDLIRRRHNIRGRVLPGNRLVKSGSTVALAAGAAINPPVVLAGVLLGKILQKPLSEIGAYDYEITGEWSEPEYRELGFSDR